jgi:hypothetical protein
VVGSEVLVGIGSGFGSDCVFAVSVAIGLPSGLVATPVLVVTIARSDNNQLSLVGITILCDYLSLFILMNRFFQC